MRIKQLACIVAVVALLPACDLFGFRDTQKPALPTTVQELTLSESSPDSTAVPEYDGVTAKSKDGEIVHVDITLLFKIDPAMVDHIQEKGGQTYITNFLPSTLRHATEAAVGIYTARQIYGEGRYDLINTLQTTVSNSISGEGFIAQDVLVRNIRFEPSLTATIESEYASAQKTALAQPIASSTP